MPASRLCVELTETLLFGEHAELIGATVRQLHAAGVRIALDDFGTGYASLTHLQKFPVDAIKIDQSFVSSIATDPGSQAITSAVLELGRRLGKDVVAEGVETAEHAEILRAAGCRQAQGYYFARPMPPEALVRLSGGAPRGRRAGAGHSGLRARAEPSPGGRRWPRSGRMRGYPRLRILDSSSGPIASVALAPGGGRSAVGARKGAVERRLGAIAGVDRRSPRCPGRWCSARRSRGKGASRAHSAWARCRARFEALRQGAARETGRLPQAPQRPIAPRIVMDQRDAAPERRSASAASQPTEPGACGDDLVPKQLDEDDLREPLQHGKPAGARAVHFAHDLTDRRAQPVAVLGRAGAEMQERRQSVPQRAEIERVTMQIAAEQAHPLRLVPVAQDRDFPPRLRRKVSRRRDQPAAAPGAELVAGAERKGDDIARRRARPPAVHLQPASSLHDDMKRDRDEWRVRPASRARAPHRSARRPSA